MNVSESLISPVLIEIAVIRSGRTSCGPSSAKSPRTENSVFESLRGSSKMEVTSEIKSLLIESQKEMLKLLKPKTGENVIEEVEDDLENETRSFYSPTKSARINSTQSNDPCTSRNNQNFASNSARIQSE